MTQRRFTLLAVGFSSLWAWREAEVVSPDPSFEGTGQFIIRHRPKGPPSLPEKMSAVWLVGRGGTAMPCGQAVEGQSDVVPGQDGGDTADREAFPEVVEGKPRSLGVWPEDRESGLRGAS